MRIFLVRNSLVITAYFLVEWNFISQRPLPLREKFLGENFFGHDGVLHGWFKSYFPKVPHPDGRIFFVRIFFGYDGVFPGLMKFYFPRRSLSSHEKFLSAILFVHYVLFCGWIDFYFPKHPSLMRYVLHRPILRRNLLVSPRSRLVYFSLGDPMVNFQLKYPFRGEIFQGNIRGHNEIFLG